MASEFDMIDRLFKQACDVRHPQTSLSNGDDASIHQLAKGQEIVVSTDMSVAGVHWPEDFPLDAAADRAVGAALSDLAAMGAQAAWAWVGVQATGVESIELLARGVAAALSRHQVELAGGDTVRSPNNALSVTVAGLIPDGQAMRRDAAQDGDGVWLCGRLGFAASGLRQWREGGRDGAFIDAFMHVRPLLDEGIRLRQLGVRCCIDVSDGLLQDGGHIARSSGLCLQLELEALPDFATLTSVCSRQQAVDDMLGGGEDYALLLTAPARFNDRLAGLARRIGQCTDKQPAGVWLDGNPATSILKGYDHFAGCR
ncbi:MAG: thiamine-phosphate kinase [Mariprofundaceae bacterium]